MKKELLGIMCLLVEFRNNKKTPKKYHREIDSFIQFLKNEIENDKPDKERLKLKFPSIFKLLRNYFTEP